MNKKPVLEVRSFPGALSEVRLSADGTPTKVSGVGVPYNRWSQDLGGFRERIAPGAFSASMRADDWRVVFNHLNHYVVGRKSAGTARFSDARDGIHYEADLPNTTWARDMAESIRRRDITENSFAMIVPESGQTWQRGADGMAERTITRATLREMGPQSFAAYSDSTSANVRSVEEVRALGEACLGGRCLTIAERRAELAAADRTLRALCGGRAGNARSTRGRPPESWELRVLRSGRHRWKLRGVALHEAGHALGAVITGTGVGAVWLQFDRDSCGALEPSGGFIRSRREWRSAWPLLAGCLAEQRGGGRPQGRGPESDSLDLAQYREVVRRSGGDANGSIDRDLAHAEAVVSRHWPAVVALADALLERGRLDGAEAEKIVLEHLDSNTRAQLERAAA